MKVDKLLSYGIVLVVFVGIFTSAVGNHWGNDVDTVLSGHEKLLGDGSPEDPYMIYDVNDLQNMSSDLYAHYELANDIDASETEGWNDGAGFVPIGEQNDEFRGGFDGQGYTISALYINRTDSDYVGLFGYATPPAEIIDVNIVDANITGKNGVGILVGRNWGAIIDDVHTEGIVSGQYYVGGLAGWNYGGLDYDSEVYNSSSDVDVTGLGHLGGLIGTQTSSTILENSFAIGEVVGDDYLGGLIGRNSGTVYHCHAEVNVTGNQYVGGLFGENRGVLYDSYSTGNVSGNIDVGGLIGNNVGAVENSYYNVENVTINAQQYVTWGGLFNDQYEDWINNGRVLYVSDYTATLIPGDVNELFINHTDGIKDMLGFSHVGEYTFHLMNDINLTSEPGLYIPYLAADFDGQGYNISNLHIDMDFNSQLGMFGYVDEESLVTDLGILEVDVSGRRRVGSIAGVNLGNISGLRTYGNVSGYQHVGGLVGYNNGVVYDSYAAGNVTGSENIGGLVGYNTNNINGSHSMSEVDGSSYVGGLVGDNWGGTIENSYSLGYVHGNSNIGGFAGKNAGHISYSYSNADVFGGQYAGGFVGKNDDTVSNCHSSSNITGSERLGGLVGWNEHTIEDSYANGNVNSTLFPYIYHYGGIVGYNRGTVVNSHYNIEVFEIDEENHVTLGGLYEAQFNDWLSNGRELHISDYSTTLVPAAGHYGIDGIQGMRDLLGFAAYEEYSFYLLDDIDLSSAPRLHIPYLAADFDGHDRTISNLFVDMDFANNIGMFGYVDGALVQNIGISGANVSGRGNVGGLAGFNDQGTIYNCHVTGEMYGRDYIGGLIGINNGPVYVSSTDAVVDGSYHVAGLIGRNFGSAVSVSNCYATGSVFGSQYLGGLIGYNYEGTVINSYSTTSVDDSANNGGLIGYDFGGSIQNSFWDNQTSGLYYSDGGSGLNTTDMMNIFTYLDASWDIVGVGDPNEGNMDHIWNIVDTETYPFFGSKNFVKIYTWTDLYNMRNDLEADYILMNDLTTETHGYHDHASENADGEQGWDPVGNFSGSFKGSFDGNGYTISGLYINRSSEDYMGLFGYVIDGTIKNVGVIDVNITGNEKVGGLIGWNLRGNISKSYITGQINGTSDVGGFVGQNDEGNIDNSSADVTVTGGFRLGGFVGFNDGRVENSYAAGSVSGDSGNIGGFIGEDSGAVINCYSAGAVSGDNDVGGFIGSTASVEIEACFWDTDTSGTFTGTGSPSPDPAGIEGKTTEEMQTMSTFTDVGWDFDEVWWMIEDETYPLHRSGVVYNVDSGRNFNNIQCAIDAPSTLDGHTIVVSPGTFEESVWIDKSIDLIGSGMDETYIDAQGDDFGFIVMANHTTVKGFTVMNATGGDPGAGIALLNPIWGENGEEGGPPETHPLINVTIEYVKSMDNNHGLIMLDVHESTITTSEFVNSVNENIYLMGSHDNIITSNICNDAEYGISITGSNNNEIYYNEVSFNEFGIVLMMSEYNNIHNNTANENLPTDDFSGMGIVLAEGSQYNDLIDNQLSDNMFGISIIDSMHNTLSGNQMISNSIVIMGGEVEHWNTHDIDLTNMVNGGPVWYVKDQTGGTVGSPAGQVILANSTGVTVDGLDISDATGGILMGFSWENWITNNEVHGNFAGMAMFNSTDNEIYGNEVYENQVGIVLESASQGNIIRDNWIYDHDEGIQIHSGDGNMIYHNVFINNNEHAYDSGDNSWDNGYPSGGNYWDDHDGPDDYSGADQDVLGSDGMIDEQRNIDGGENVDNYPWTNAQFALQITFSNAAPQDGATSVPLNTTLSVYVEADGHPTEVEFYLEGTFVYSETIASNGVVETDAMEDLDYVNSYNWYVVSTNDGGNNYTRSQDYVFTTLDHFILTLNIQGEGTVEVDGEELFSGSQWMDEGLATIKAIPNSGWEFEEWTGDTQNIADIFSEETTIDMKDDYSITAIFQLSEYDLTIDSTDGGSVTDPGEGTFTYTYGGWVNLQAQADTNYVFVEWTGDTENIEDVNAANTHIIVEGDYNITAVFELQYDFYELTVNTEGDGNVTVSPEPDATMGKYQEGTWVYLDSSPDPSWELSHWSGDLPEGHEEYDQIGIYMDSDKTVTAHFVYVEMFELTVNIEGSGSLDISPNQAEYEDGTLVDIHALPSDGWEFSHWTGDIPDEYEYSSYISVSMDRDRTLTAHFVEEIPDDVDRYHLDTVVEGSGYVDVDPWKSEYIDGDRVELTAVPEFGWEFVEWTGDASGTSSEITITMDGNKTVVAVFQQTAAEIEVTGFVVDPTEGDEPLTVSISANIENIGTGSGTIQLTMGTDPVGQWTLEPGDTISVDETHTFEELGLYYFHLGNQSIAVRVGDVVVYSLNVVVEGEGSVRPTQELYEEGETVTLTAVPVDGWEFVEWTGDYLAADTQITFNMDQDKTITAVFREVDDPDDPDDPDDTDDQEEDPNFMDSLSDYWWILVVVALIGVILLVFVMKRGKTPTPMEESPVEENEEMTDDEPLEEFDELDDMEESSSEEEF